MQKKSQKKDLERHSTGQKSSADETGEVFPTFLSRSKRIKKALNRKRIDPFSNDVSPLPEQIEAGLNDTIPQQFDAPLFEKITEQPDLKSPMIDDNKSFDPIQLESPPKDLNFSAMMESVNRNQDDELHLDQQIDEQFKLAANFFNQLSAASGANLGLLKRTTSEEARNKNDSDRENEEGSRLDLSELSGPILIPPLETPSMNIATKSRPNPMFVQPFREFLERFDIDVINPGASTFNTKELVRHNSLKRGVGDQLENFNPLNLNSSNNKPISKQSPPDIPKMVPFESEAEAAKLPVARANADQPLALDSQESTKAAKRPYPTFSTLNRADQYR